MTENYLISSGLLSTIVPLYKLYQILRKSHAIFDMSQTIRGIRYRRMDVIVEGYREALLLGLMIY